MEHSKVGAQHSQLEYSVLPQLAFAYLAHSSVRSEYSPRSVQSHLTQHSGCHSVHLARCSMRQQLDLMQDCQSAHHFQ